MLIRVQVNLKMKPDEQVPAAEYSTVDFTQKGRQYGGLLDTLFTMDTTMYIRMNLSTFGNVSKP